MLRSLCEDYPTLMDDIQFAAATKYRLTVDNLPSPEQGKECPAFPGKLCRDPYYFNPEAPMTGQEFDEARLDNSSLRGDEMGSQPREAAISAESFLVRRYHSPVNAFAEPIQGDIGQETLTQIVSRDELVPQRKRHPWLDIRTMSFARRPSFGMCILQNDILQTYRSICG